MFSAETIVFCCCPELTEGCLESPNGDLDVKQGNILKGIDNKTV